MTTFKNKIPYQNTTERKLEDVTPAADTFDTWQRIQISNPTGITDFVPDWQLYKSRDYLQWTKREKTAFNPYKKRQMSDYQGKKIDIMFSSYKKTV